MLQETPAWPGLTLQALGPAGTPQAGSSSRVHGAPRNNPSQAGFPRHKDQGGHGDGEGNNAGAINYECIFTAWKPKKCRERQDPALPPTAGTEAARCLGGRGRKGTLRDGTPGSRTEPRYP